MKQALDELDAAIAKKEEEISALKYARALLSGEEAPPPQASHGKEANSTKADKGARLKAIAKSAGKTGRTAPAKKGSRRKFSEEQRRAIVAEYNEAKRKDVVLKKHSITYSHISRWKEMDPSPGIIVEAPPAIPATDEDEVPVIDLVDELEGGGNTPVPFVQVHQETELALAVG
jgi:hypothetical protein